MLGLLLKTCLLGKVLEREAEEGVSIVSIGDTGVRGVHRGGTLLANFFVQILPPLPFQCLPCREM